jgi:dipeptidyl aminopeptidase/acylaminoacyl peptidase
MNQPVLRACLALLIAALFLAGGTVAQAPVPAGQAVPGLPYVHAGDLWRFDPEAAAAQRLTADAVIGPMALSADGARLAYWRLAPLPTAGMAAELWVIDLANGESSRLAAAEGTVGRPAWSPDGTTLAWAADGALWAAPLASTPRRITDVVSAGMSAPDVAWNAAGTAIIAPAVIDTIAGMWSLPADGTAASWLLPLGEGAAPHVAVSPDGDIYIHDGEALWLANLEHPAQARTIAISGLPTGVAVNDLAFAPNGAHLAMATADGFGLITIDAPTATENRTYLPLDTPAGPGLRLHWADAETLLFGKPKRRPPLRRFT